MKFGLMLANQHPVGTDLVEAMADQISLARAARETGWDSVFTGQHYLADGLADMQPVPFLARIAAETGDMAIGVGIQLLALQNPVEVAENYAALDVITGGRLIFGVGLGYRKPEYAALGVPWEGKVARFVANLEIVRRLWAGEEVHADLDWCRLDGARLALRPVQRPGPPVWIAANSDAAIRRAAQLSDAWFINPQGTLDSVRRQLAIFEQSRTESGNAPASTRPAMREIFCAEDRSTATAIAEHYLAEKYRVYSSWGSERSQQTHESFTVPFEDLAGQRFIIGTPDDCVAALGPWAELGIDHVVLRTHWAGMPAHLAEQSVRLIGDEVLPAFRDRADPSRQPDIEPSNNIFHHTRLDPDSRTSQ